MAQSRPPPVRVHAATGGTSPPPLSPRTHSEKRHHSRRKSGKAEYAASERKSSRPATLTRKSTPQYVTKAGSTGRPQYREREEEERSRDSGESFPQFCMSCEKQFLSADNTFLYCSEACRIHDLNPPPSSRANSYPPNPNAYTPTTHSPPLTPYTRHFPTHEDGPDIIPRFSPTQSRPRSYFASDPYPSSYQAPSHILSASTSQHDYADAKSSTALESLRELATALPKSNSRRKSSRGEPESPPKSSASSMTKNGSAVWGYIPFTSKTPTPSATPGNSYTQSTHTPYTVSQSQSYGAGYGYSNGGRSGEDLYNYGKSQGTAYTASGYGNTGGMGMDRPLPPRSGPGGYGHRPRSIDLVTPFSGGH